MKIAIIAVAYNRVDSLCRLLHSLNIADYSSNEVSLIISVDKSNTTDVESFSDAFQWKHGPKIVDKHETNLGLRNHMLSLGKWFEKFEALVVLEDDIVVSPCFYHYACSTVERYQHNEKIAGISLYGFEVNYQTLCPFVPLKNQYDVFLMNCAMSWGEIWMKDSWQTFYNWYLNNQNFSGGNHLPNRICSWNPKSWLKYHTRYCIEEDKYFVFPYVSLSTNFGDAGEHNNGLGNTIFQVELQYGEKKHFELPDIENAICYDGFFENKSLYSILGLNERECCLDLNGGNHNIMEKRYWITCEIADFSVVHSYGLNVRPIELNIINDIKGCQILLYDTSKIIRNKNKGSQKSNLFFYHIDNSFNFVRQYGFVNFIKDFIEILKLKINKYGK